MRSRILLFLLLVSCSSGPQDPLKNTKKLVKEGHATLYQNGAFSVPATKIKLIPPGPAPVEFAQEMLGLRAKASFLRYVNEVKESSVVIWDGTKKSYAFAQKVDRNLDREITTIVPQLRKGSKLMLKKTFAESSGIVGSSWELSQRVGLAVAQEGKEIRNKSFVRHYVILPKSISRASMSQTSVQEFTENFKETVEMNKQLSSGTTYLLGDAFSQYGSRIGKSFDKAGQEIVSSHTEFGVSLAALKSIRWVLDGILWQGVILPTGKVTAGALGYVLVNGVALPVMLVTKSGMTSTVMLIEVVRDASLNTYELLAPSVEVGLSSILTGGVSAGSFVLGNAVEYVVAPMTQYSLALGGGVTGVAVGVTGGILGGATRISGETLGLSSNAISKSAAGITLVGGVAFYTLKGTAEVAYEVTKATVVPPSLVLGSGLALSYGTVAQLGAQSVLAVADASYLVLSLEGPKWVVYAVSGKLAQEDPPPGAILDLEEMKKSGEEFRRVPVNDEDMKKILEDLGA